jgi:hypothetical protein
LIIANTFPPPLDVQIDTGIQIQNAGDAPTDITVTYTPALTSAGGKGTACTQSMPNVGPGESANFGVNAILTPFRNSNCNNPDGFIGWADVSQNSSNQPLVAIVNQAEINQAISSAYTGFNPANATSQVNIPLIVKDLPLPGGANLFTGLNLVNVGTAVANVTCSFANTSVALNLVIQPDEVVNLVQTGGTDALPDDYVGSAICLGGTDDKIVAIVNESQFGGVGDFLLTYEGFNQ